MTEKFLQKIALYIEENEMILSKDVVFAGVSGGADSMCLLAVLLAYQRQVDFALHVVHVEHGIRGAESLMDAAYVEQFCRERGVPCEVVHVDAAGYARAQHLSVEEAARILRHEAFRRFAAQAGGADRQEEAEIGGMPDEGGHPRRSAEAVGQAVREPAGAHVRIAVAHHREDQAETVLWQMIRGSDVRGLGGMHPKRGAVIRPLLGVTRGEIEDYLNASGISWREDCTNASADYTRNRIRREVLPVLGELNAQAVRHIFETAGRLRETEDFLREQTALSYERFVEPAPGGGLLLREALTQTHPLLLRRVIYRALCVCLGQEKDIGGEHVRLLEGLFSLQVGRVLHLPCKGRAQRVYGGVRLYRAAFGAAGQGAAFAGEAGENVPFLPEQVRMEVLEHFDLTEISKKKYTKWFNYDKIKDNVQIRHRRSGDYLVIDGEGHRQKLSRYLVNEKIPREEREHLLVVADGAHVMWVIGHRISDYYKVDKDTKRVLKVQLSGGKEYE